MRFEENASSTKPAEFSRDKVKELKDLGWEVVNLENLTIAKYSKNIQINSIFIGTPYWMD